MPYKCTPQIKTPPSKASSNQKICLIGDEAETHLDYWLEFKVPEEKLMLILVQFCQFYGSVVQA